jgi:tryptophan synthase beta chain
MECVVYMGSEDVKRQAANVYRMKLLGADRGAGRVRLEDAQGRAQRSHARLGDQRRDTFYIIGTVAGPHPYPMMVRDFQSVIGEECKAQMPDMPAASPTRDRLRRRRLQRDGHLPSLHRVPGVKLIGVEAGGRRPRHGRHAASLTAGRPACCTATAPTCCRTRNGQIIETHSVSAGLDYPGVGPEHAWLKDTGRAEYVGTITDAEALEAFHNLCRLEGIIPALESSHALAYAAKLAPTLPKDKILLVNLSGRGDKDMHTVAERSGLQF